MSNSSLYSALKNKELIFWDFDGVIKESLEVKANAFVEIFSKEDKFLQKKIRQHHLDNGGMSRFEKIPLYLKWAGDEPNHDKVSQLSFDFSNHVIDKVVKSPWVPGIENFLKKCSVKFSNILVSSTPDDELKKITSQLKISRRFDNIYGSSTTKIDCISLELLKSKVRLKKAIMIGDSEVDFNAAKKNKIDFIMRKTRYNQKLISENNIIFFNNYL